MIVPFDPYRDISSAVEDTDSLWEVSEKNAGITLQSSSFIRPQIVEIDFRGDFQTEMMLIGLQVSLEREVLPFFLGKFTLEPGVNVLNCQLLSC